MTEKLFGNIGKKLKTIAVVFCYIDFIAFLILGFITWVSAIEGMGFVGFVIGLFFDALVVAVGSLIGWLSTLVLYAFGQLLENSDRTTTLLENAEKARLATGKASIRQAQADN